MYTNWTLTSTGMFSTTVDSPPPFFDRKISACALSGPATGVPTKTPKRLPLRLSPRPLWSALNRARE